MHIINLQTALFYSDRFSAEVFSIFLCPFWYFFSCKKVKLATLIVYGPNCKILSFDEIFIAVCIYLSFLDYLGICLQKIYHPSFWGLPRNLRLTKLLSQNAKIFETVALSLLLGMKSNIFPQASTCLKNKNCNEVVQNVIIFLWIKFMSIFWPSIYIILRFFILSNQEFIFKYLSVQLNTFEFYLINRTVIHHSVSWWKNIFFQKS